MKLKITIWGVIGVAVTGSLGTCWVVCGDSMLFWTALSAIGQIAAIPALLFAAYSFKRGAKMQHYEKIDEMYADLLRISLDKECISHADKCTTPQERHQYDTYAYMVWNLIETIYDRCEDDDDLMETWAPVIRHEIGKHREWLMHPRNRLRFKATFLSYLYTHHGMAFFNWRRATPEDLPAISALQERFFGEDAIPARQYCEWFEQSPAGFFVFESAGPGRELLGHVTFLKIREGVLQRYLAGSIKEQQIAAHDLIKLGTSDSAQDLYLESVIITEPAVRRSIRPYLWEAIGLMIESLPGGPIGQVYAMAATKAGRRFLERACFTMVDPPLGKTRLDRHEMYVASYAAVRALSLGATAKQA